MIEVTSENFKQEVLESKKKVIVDFNAEWCGPCQIQGPILEDVETEIEDICKIVSVDIDDQDVLAIEYEISSIPCLVLFDGGEEIDRKIGLQSQKKIIKWVRK